MSGQDFVFLPVGSGNGYGSGCGYGNGSNISFNYGSGSGSGAGYVYRSCSRSGFGFGNGDGFGNGTGYGYETPSPNRMRRKQMTDKEQKPVFLASSEAQVAYALHIVDKKSEQPEQKPVAWMYTDAQGKEVIVKADVAPYEDAVPLYTAPQLAQHEPVAEVKAKTTGGNPCIATVIHEIYNPFRERLYPGEKLYRSQYAEQKPWVDLTDDENEDLLGEFFLNEANVRFVRKIETKLRRINK